ncbi:arylsulfatase [Cyclobacterium sp. SYSU L10401]|uniref:arylsulfatase n=1 Tax=Cyclobacterium sp. SYSU L10401 TaxID=2678657 RepID=UPI0013D746AD|nr:arylsulfatase [Cyclobacterium sp. SYSU L10401]
MRKNVYTIWKVSKRNFADFLVFLVLFSCVKKEEVKTSPNVIIVLADDMGYSDLGITGSEILTSNLDKLARNGVLFTACYNASRCCPSRASLLTGLYSHKAGIGHMDSDLGLFSYQGFLDENVTTIAEAFRDQDYRTIMTGKWHVGNERIHWPDRRGFDRFYGIPAGGGLYFYPSNYLDRPIYRNQEQVFPDSASFYSTNNFTTEAIGFIEEAVLDQKPFFAYLAYIAPHFPLQALPEDIKKYNGVYDQGYEYIRSRRFEKQKKLGIVSDDIEISLPEFPSWETVENKAEEIKKMQVYAAQVDRLDQNIGILIDQLKNLGVYENTVIIFLSDNGASREAVNRSGNAPIGGADSFVSYGMHWANVSNTPFRSYKSETYEGGIRTPLLFSLPCDPNSNGKVIEEPIHIIDIMPTLLDITGISLEEGDFDGKSFLGLIAGTKDNHHQALFWEHQGNKAVWNNGFKLVQMHEKDWELYNLTRDPYETEESTSTLKDSLKNRWNQWAYESGVESWPIPKPR